MKNRIVFSTDPNFNDNIDNDESLITIDKGKQDIRIWLEKRPGNKVVSIVKDFVGTQSEMKKLERHIKKQCGVGGSVKGKDIIIQTKDRKKILSILNKLGYSAKLSGG